MAFNIFRRFTKRFFIICNLLLALLFVLSCYVGYLNPKYFWWLSLLSFGSFFLFLILLAAILFWLFLKPRYAFISMVAILVCWGPIKHLFQIKMTPNFVMKKHPAHIRMMSWNVEHFDILEHKTHPERKQEMIDIINTHQPDIACFQEMVGSDSIPGAINSIPDFMSSLGMRDYHYSYNKKLDFDGQHRFGIIIFSKYPIISKHTLSYAPNDYNSIFQYADIVKGEDTFRVFNIHLQSLRFTENDREYINNPTLDEKRDLKESMSVLKKLKEGFLRRGVQSNRIKKAMYESPYPVILAGDFNDVPNSYAYNTLGKNMRNAFAEKGTGIGRTYSGISPTLRIDNIFVDKRFSVAQYVRIMRKLSDHYPILADLYYNKVY